LFQPADEITEAFKEGAIGRLKGFDVFEEQSLWSHTAGTWAGAVTVTGAGQSGTSLIITGTNGRHHQAGRQIRIANVNFVNPRTRRTPGPLTPQTFTATARLRRSPAAPTRSRFCRRSSHRTQRARSTRTSTHLPINGAALTLFPGTPAPNGATGTVGLALTKQAFAIVGMRFYLPKAVEARQPGRRQADRHPGAFRQGLGSRPLDADSPLRHRVRLRQPVPRQRRSRLLGA
jgi:hypothetical protein